MVCGLFFFLVGVVVSVDFGGISYFFCLCVLLVLFFGLYVVVVFVCDDFDFVGVGGGVWYF